MKYTITEMKNTLKGINSRLNDTEENIGELEDIVETTETGHKFKKKLNEDKLRHLKDNIKHINI